MGWKWIRYILVSASLPLGLFALPLVMPLAKPETLARYYHTTGLDKTGSFKWEDQFENGNDSFRPLAEQAVAGEKKKFMR